MKLDNKIKKIKEFLDSFNLKVQDWYIYNSDLVLWQKGYLAKLNQDNFKVFNISLDYKKVPWPINQEGRTFPSLKCQFYEKYLDFIKQNNINLDFKCEKKINRQKMVKYCLAKENFIWLGFTTDKRSLAEKYNEILANRYEQDKKRILNTIKKFKKIKKEAQKDKDKYVIEYCDEGVLREQLLLKALKDNKEVANGKILRGRTINKANLITGYIIYLYDFRNANLIRENNYILVANDIQPEQFIYLKNFKGLITEVSGLLSHAAILSREFGLPHIGGISNIYKTFKDVKRVSLDTEKSIIKIIE